MLSFQCNTFFGVVLPCSGECDYSFPVDGEHDYYIQILSEEFDRRRQARPVYSLRAFAKSLEIDAGTISRVLNSRQVPSYGLSTRIVQKLKLTAEQEGEFFKSVSTASERKANASTINFWKGARSAQIVELDNGLYDDISDWHHVAIMEMTYLNGFLVTPNAVAGKLGITEEEAALAIRRLSSLGLVEMRNGRLAKKDKDLSTAQKNVTTAALKKNQKQFLNKAIESLEKEAIEKRSTTSMTMAIDPQRLASAKRMIHDFNQALCRYLEQGKRTRIYNLSIALNPLDIEGT